MFYFIASATNLSVLLIVWSKCTLAASHPAAGEYADKTDRQTDGRQTVTLRFPLDVANVITTCNCTH